MSDEPPDHVTNAGPPARQGRRNDAPVDRKAIQEARAQLEAESARIIAHFNNPQTQAEFKAQLPGTLKIEDFNNALKSALLKNIKLAHPQLRASLLRAIAQAANQGLKPDGKEGALVVRKNWDPDTRTSDPEVCWQPMVWGIVKLGRQTGAIQNIRANIVFNNEVFRYLQGDLDSIEHEVNPDIVETAYSELVVGVTQYGDPIANPDKFFHYIRGAYCVITPVEGDPVKRYMTRSRLLALKQSAKAKSGPWNGPFVDEMILKATILFTSKWVNLDYETVAAKAFQSALLQDNEIDFDAEPHHQPPPQLEAPGRKLDGFEQMFGKEKEKVELKPKPETETKQSTTSDFPGDDNYKPPPPKEVKRTPEGDERARKWGRGMVAEVGLRISTAELDALENAVEYGKRLEYLRHVDLGLANEIDLAMIEMRETLRGT